MTLCRPLTEREREVLGLMAEGVVEPWIQERLFLGEKTFGNSCTQYLIKLDIPEDPGGHRRMLAVLTYLKAR